MCCGCKLNLVETKDELYKVVSSMLGNDMKTKRIFKESEEMQLFPQNFAKMSN